MSRQYKSSVNPPKESSDTNDVIEIEDNDLMTTKNDNELSDTDKEEEQESDSKYGANIHV